MPHRPLVTLALPAVVLALAASASGMTLAYGDHGGPPDTATTGETGDATFVLTGAGYGHGVGLSQYGALAQARAGRASADILSFYYPGTTSGTSATASIRVLLVLAAPSLTLSSTAPFSLRDGAGTTVALPAGAITLGPDLQLPVDGVPTAFTGSLTFIPTTGALLSLGDTAYRGRLEVSSSGTALQAIDVVSVEAYVQGVVPAEMPSTWPPAALQAQAVAARSYALASIVKGKPWDVYPDGRSQAYRGASAETPATTAAVRATARQILLYGGKVATTFYSSSSGGQTASALDVFGLALPYLPSQADPWDDGSPYHVWQPRSYTGAQLAKAFGLAAPVVEAQASVSPSSRIATLVLLTATGGSLEISGGEARKRLALRSTAFRLGTLRFLTQASPTTAGTPLRMAGIARDVQDAVLERLDASGAWVPVVRRLPVQPDGSFATVVRPKVTTTYRLSASGLPGPALTIPVVGAAG